LSVMGQDIAFLLLVGWDQRGCYTGSNIGA